MRALSSPRKRRRAGWLLASAVLVCAVAALVIKFPSPSNEASGPSSARGWAPPEQPDPVTPTARTRREGLSVAARFVETAVARKRVADSWDLVVPSMKTGYTRATWARGDIPVVPYPVGGARWRLDYSFGDSMGLQVALFPKPGVKIPATVFNLDLRAIGKGTNRRWLVEGFTPGPVGTVPTGAPTSPLGFANLGQRPGNSRLSGSWLLVPFGLISLIILVPLGLGINHWYRGSRAERDYARSRAA